MNNYLDALRTTRAQLFGRPVVQALSEETCGFAVDKLYSKPFDVEDLVEYSKEKGKMWVDPKFNGVSSLYNADF